MLVLKRKVGQSITIDNNINVKILSDKHGGISVGIEAPKYIRIVRDELLSHTKSNCLKHRFNNEIIKP